MAIAWSNREIALFRSARFKLTVFYLAIILALSLTLSFGTRWIAQHEFERGNVAQRGAFRGVVTRTLGIEEFAPNDRAFYFQQLQEQRLRAKLDQYVLIVNLGALLIGGLASYVFAGWTLRPIEEAHEAQKRFASDASHELRTPLTAIKIENEVFLRQKNFDKAEAHSLIQSNLEEVDRLERLARNLLAMTEYENTTLPLASIQLESIIDEAVQQTKRAYPKAEIVAELTQIRVVGNRESLVHLFGIVLDNACKYGPADKPVTITARVVESRCEVRIADKGKGIAADDLPYIFDRLYRGDKARSSATPGHGLGLALAKRIATVNHGTIQAANQKGGGAAFTITLPLA